MNKKDFMKRMLVALLSLVITITYMPATVFAAPASNQGETQTDTTVEGGPFSEDKASEETAATDAEVSKSEEAAVTEENSVSGEASEKEIGSDSEKASDSEETTEAEDNSVSEEASEPENDSAAEDVSVPEEIADEDNSPEANALLEEKEDIPFIREAEIDDVIVKVEAEPGVFPDDAEIVVERADKNEEVKATEAIDEVRPDDYNVVDSYTFDIKVVDSDGGELQPADDQKVNVTFCMKRAADPNLSADVYHIAEREVINEETKKPETVLEAEKLDAETDAKDETVTAETDGFSLYSVEFSYRDMTYYVELDPDKESVPVRTILDEMEIEGDVVSVNVGEQPYFFYGGGNITFASPFEGALPLIIKIASPTYHILSDYRIDVEYCRAVSSVDSWTALQNAVNDSANNGKTIRLAQSIYANGADRILIEGKKITIDLCGFTMDRQRGDDNDSDGHVIELQDGADLTIKDSSAGGTGIITGGYANNGGGIHVGEDCICNIEGGTITGNKADEDGGGVFIRGMLNMTGGAISGNYADDTGGGIYCTDSGTFILRNVTISDNTADNDGGGLNIHLCSDATIKNCKITGNRSNSEDGGAFRMEADGNTLLISDTEIINNRADETGGAITIYEGKVEMVRVSITGNEAESGGAVYNKDTIDFSDVEFSGNTANKGDGAGIYNTGDANLENCSFNKNVGMQRGGGIYSDEDITIKSCSFTENSAAADGGGVCIDDAELYLENCTFKNNYAGNTGGGLFIKDDTTNIAGTTVIEGNTSYGTGGGIFIDDDATLNMEGDVSITGNSASNGGSGMLIGASSGNEVNLKGKIYISHNEGYQAPDVLFCSRADRNGSREVTKLNLQERLAEGSAIGVAVDYDIIGRSAALTSGYRDCYGDTDPTTIFGGDNETTVQTDPEGEIVLHASAWPTLQKLINEAANNNTTLKLQRNWKGSVYDLPLTIPAGKTLVLDLNGYTIDRKLASEAQRENGEVFDVEEGRTLIINDNTGKKSGRITGGNGINGGAVHVQAGGTLELKGGNITANKAENGGAVYNEGSVTISGEDAVNAAIYGNTAKLGGGIYNKGTLTVDCDGIRGNTANVGGGVYNAAGTMNLSGAISGNETNESAGGVYLAAGSALNVSGAASVRDNTSAAGGNLFLAGDNTIVNITGELTDGAFFDVVAQNSDPENDRKLTGGWNENKGACTFSYNGKIYDNSSADGKITEKEGDLWLKGVNDGNIEWVSNWKELYQALGSDDTKVIAFKNDIYPAGKDDEERPLWVKETKKTVDLCGFSLDSRGTLFKKSNDHSATVIRVGEVTDVGIVRSGELELRDSVGTGMITGGTAIESFADEGRAITIAKESKCTIIDCAISGNMTLKDGGGIYNAGELEMIGGSVTGNSAPEGTGGGIFNTGKMTLNGVTVSENSARSRGGGICIAPDWTYEPDDSQITGCRIDSNTSQTAHGGGIFVNMDGKTLSVEDSAIERNHAVYEEKIEWDPIRGKYTNHKDNNGGGIYLKAGTINMKGGSVTGNTAENGGGISNGGAISDGEEGIDAGGSIVINGTKIDGNKSVGQVCSDDNKETSFGGVGAGIYNTNNLRLTACTISNNKSDENGAGVWTYSNNELVVEDCTFESNQAETVGGGIHLAAGKLTLTGSDSAGTVFKDNEAYDDGAGIQADGELHIKGNIRMPNNAIFLPAGKKIIVDDKLTQGSVVDVALAEAFGVFTDGYKNYHQDDEPEEYFCSDYGYGVFKTADNEAELKLVVDDGSKFIDLNNQVKDVSRLTRANWMSGISGDRYLNEINIPCTHDSAMNEVNWHRMSSVGSFLGYEEYAKTQVRHIDEQMNDGVRRLDIRLNNRYEKSYVFGIWISYKDDDENLWLCHGKTWTGGTFWAGNHDGDDLSFNEVWGWVKDFLQKHPTETIILDLAPEPVNSWGHDKDDDIDTIKERARKHLADFSQEINPSTGKPYVYWEKDENGNPKIFETFTRFPQLKECRGQVIFDGDCELGGMSDYTMGNTINVDQPKGEQGESASEKIQSSYEFFTKENTSKLRYIPTDVTKHLNDIYKDSALTAPTGSFGIPSDTPLNAADQIHDALYYGDNDDTGVFNQRGQYVGWIRGDGATARLNHVIWISNFPEDNPETPEEESLKYFTVTAESGITEEEAIAAGLDPKKVKPQTFQLLRGTEFPIPGDIYGYNKELSGWDAKVPSGEETGSETKYEPGSKYKVMSDVTFTANWGVDPPVPTEETGVRVAWIDRDNKDQIRPDAITVKYKTKGSEDEQTIEFPAEGMWDTTVDGEVTEVTSVSDDGTRIIPTEEYPHGQDKEGEYAYSIINNRLTGCVITLYHTPSKDPEPEEDVLITGTIAWDDNDDEEEKRPKSVVVHLLKNGEDTGVKKTITYSQKWSWFFDLSSLDDYDPEATYSVSQDAVPYYTTEVTGSAEDGYVIKNTIVSEEHQHDFTEIDAKTATCLEDGNIKYWICNKGEKPCNRCFSDAEGQNEVDPAKTVDKGGIIIPATGHYWGETTYTWADDNSSVTAERSCKREGCGAKETETAETTSKVTKPATCTEAGETTYSAIFKNEAFEEQSKTDKTIPAALGHDWDEPTYTWTDDNSSVTAERGCRRDGCRAKETETAETTSEVTKPATCTEAGETVYTATFENEAFDNQLKTDKTIPAALGHDWSEPKYTWADDNSSVTAEHSCQREGCGVKETETAETTSEVTKPATCTEAGETVYTATFENEAFDNQSKTDKTVPAALGHDWSEPKYTWADDNSSVTAERSCKREGCNEKETETAETTTKVIREATADEDGEMLYTVTFDNEAFSTQTKTVVIPKTGASYDFRKGDEQTWYIGSDKTADFTIKRSANDSTTFSHFAGIKIDGKEVAEKHYTKEAGSVIIKLKLDYLNTLKLGKHTITAEFDDGNAEATFNIADKGSDDPGKDPDKDPDKEKDPDKKSDDGSDTKPDNGSDNKGSDNDGDSGSDNSSDTKSSDNGGDNSTNSGSGNSSDNNSDSDSVNSAENDSDADADNGSDSSDSSVTRGKGARTGDETDIFTWIVIMLSTILAMTGYVISRRRR